MVIKWIKGFLKHPINVIKGNLFRFTGENELLYMKRYYGHCRHCKERESSPIGDICGICGCPFQSKLRLEDESCDLLKW